ncbi:DUF6600 domain-containing protein [Pinirhizobacter sp.]|uniref:DUF6600 domain-containing protein n=1 Tax=Pinirhizobacter sp. TaxID=2950432 RepID=UPI002F4060C3
MTASERFLLGVAFAAMVATGALHAQDNSTSPQVARISYVHGDASLFANGAGPWEPAKLNRPLAQGERLATKGSSLAEVDLGGTVLRLGGTSELGVSSLSPAQARFALPSGVLQVSVRTLNPGQTLEIDTDKVAVLIDKPGRYRFEAGKAYTAVKLREGSASAYGKAAGPLTLKAGQSYRFDNASLTALAVSGLAPSDAFDTWTLGRDGSFVAPATTQYVSSDTVGYQDLDRYGTWQEDPQDGAVWYPNDVAQDWEPYDSGSWDYVDPWGWTYVDDQPWGFAPFHYGTWTHRHGRWGWVPGRRRLHDPGFEAAQVPPPPGHGRPGQSWAAANTPASSFPEIRRFQQHASQPNGPAPGDGRSWAQRGHDGRPHDFNVMRVPDRSPPTVVSTVSRVNRDAGASARPGLSFIAPNPGQMQQVAQSRARVVSTNDMPQTSGFVPRVQGDVVHTYRGNLDGGARPQVQYMSRPISPPGDGWQAGNGHGWHGGNDNGPQGGNGHGEGNGNHGGWQRPPPAQPAPGNQVRMSVPARTVESRPAGNGNGNGSRGGNSGVGTVR